MITNDCVVSTKVSLFYSMPTLTLAKPVPELVLLRRRATKKWDGVINQNDGYFRLAMFISQLSRMLFNL